MHFPSLHPAHDKYKQHAVGQTFPLHKASPDAAWRSWVSQMRTLMHAHPAEHYTVTFHTLSSADSAPYMELLSPFDTHDKAVIDTWETLGEGDKCVGVQVWRGETLGTDELGHAHCRLHLAADDSVVMETAHLKDALKHVPNVNQKLELDELAYAVPVTKHEEQERVCVPLYTLGALLGSSPPKA